MCYTPDGQGLIGRADPSPSRAPQRHAAHDGSRASTTGPRNIDCAGCAPFVLGHDVTYAHAGQAAAPSRSRAAVSAARHRGQLCVAALLPALHTRERAHRSRLEIGPPRPLGGLVSAQAAQDPRTGLQMGHERPSPSLGTDRWDDGRPGYGGLAYEAAGSARLGSAGARRYSQTLPAALALVLLPPLRFW